MSAFRGIATNPHRSVIRNARTSTSGSSVRSHLPAAIASSRHQREVWGADPKWTGAPSPPGDVYTSDTKEVDTERVAAGRTEDEANAPGACWTRPESSAGLGYLMRKSSFVSLVPFISSRIHTGVSALSGEPDTIDRAAEPAY